MEKEKYLEILRTENDYRKASRKLFITFPNFVFQDKEDIHYDIINKIAEYFNIPLYQIKIVGSSQLGYSLVKKTEFVEGSSDLDISIISQDLFVKYLELTNRLTNSFADLTKFKEGNDRSFYKYISKGIFRPDLMPNCAHGNISYSLCSLRLISPKLICSITFRTLWITMSGLITVLNLLMVNKTLLINV